MSTQQLFVILRRIGANWVVGTAIRKQPLWEEHAAYMDELDERGKIALAGPFTDGSGAMVIVRVQDEQEARAIFGGDPWVTQEILDCGEVKGWEIFIDGMRPKEAST